MIGSYMLEQLAEILRKKYWYLSILNYSSRISMYSNIPQGAQYHWVMTIYEESIDYRLPWGRGTIIIQISNPDYFQVLNQTINDSLKCYDE